MMVRFYEPLEPLGEGSMGSVSKVRKRSDVIGGSARPDYVEKHAQPKILEIFPFLRFFPIQRQFSNEYYQASPAITRRGSGSELKIRKEQNCFTMFCCPAKKNVSSVLDPISEDASVAMDIEISQSDKNSFQGCWDGIFGGFSRQLEPPKPDKDSDIDTSDNSEDVVKKEDYEAIGRQLDRALKRSTSSLITYGHKDAVYALKSIHLDRVSNSDFLKELKNEVSILKQLDHPNIVKVFILFCTFQSALYDPSSPLMFSFLCFLLCSFAILIPTGWYSKCFETFNYNKSLFLVLEICSGSDLYSRDPYTEMDARKIIRSVLSAVAYMHSKRITHRGRCNWHACGFIVNILFHPNPCLPLFLYLRSEVRKHHVWKSWPGCGCKNYRLWSF